MKRALIGLAVLALIGAGGDGLAGQAKGSEQHHPGSAHGGTMNRDMMEGMMGQGGMMPPDMMGGMMGPMMAPGGPAERPLISLALHQKDKLGLSDEQVKTLEAIRATFQEDAEKRSASLRRAEAELQELLVSDSVDLAKVEAKLKESEALRTELRLSRIKALEQGKAVLTPEQRKKLKTLASQAADPMPGMMRGRGMEEMHRFMQSEGMMESMTSMMEMARRMGEGDVMLGMVRMMEMMRMMGSMGQMRGPSGDRPMGGMPMMGR